VFVELASSRSISVSRACELAGVSRRRLGYVPRRGDDELVARLMEVAKENPRYGCRHLCAMLRRGGLLVNIKRVRRLCRKHGLLLRQKRRRKRRGIGCGVPCRSEHPNQVWAYDFMEDRTETGRKLRILTIEDEFTRECVGVEVEHRMNAKFVAMTLLQRFAERGVPRFIRSDNGSEFIARFLMRVLAIHGVEARHIDPGSPWQNGLNERFNGTLRDECLNLETFHNRDHARAIVKLHARRYTQDRPHSSLGYQTPAEFAAKWKKDNEGIGCAARLSSPKSAADLGSAQTRDLSHQTPPAERRDKSGPGVEARPVSRKAIHDDAPVASQQSRILRVDATRLAKPKRAGKFPAQIS
jgi:transposase InsO family protein